MRLSILWAEEGAESSSGSSTGEEEDIFSGSVWRERLAKMLYGPRGWIGIYHLTAGLNLTSV